MNDQERLFLAIGEADLDLVARSERTRQNTWIPWGLAVAACLVLLLSRVLPLWLEPSITPPDSQNPPSVTRPNLPENPNAFFLPEQGHEIGTLRLLSYTPESQDETVDFLIYVNEEQFSIQEENGLYSIRSVPPLPEDFPECGMDIFHISGTSPSQARQKAEEALKDHYSEISQEELAAVLPDSLYLRANENLKELPAEEFWRAQQAELWFVSDGRGGSFVIAARYFLEAEEGIGARFRDMASSFRVVDRSETVPDWMRALYETTDQLFPALFSNDLSSISGLLTEKADVDAYDENVWPEITMISVDYTLDNDQDPTEAMVSVKHRLNQVEGDSFRYLTMELIRQDGSWYLNWSGIEK